MGEQCICCRTKTIIHQKRMLCNTCYAWLRVNGRLAEFPCISKLTHNKWWMKKHGEALVSDIKNLMEGDNGSTLSSVGKKHGLSRERIRQLFESIHGFKYTVAVKAKGERADRRAYEKRILHRDPRYKVENYKKYSLKYKGAETEKKVFDICVALHYDIQPFPSHTIDLVINGYRVEIKSSHQTCFTRKSGRTSLYHFSLKESQKHADFIICHAVPVNKFFIIPKAQYPTSGELYLPSINKREWNTGTSIRSVESKYYKYLEAWHLLKPQPQEVVFSQPTTGQMAAIG